LPGQHPKQWSPPAVTNCIVSKSKKSATERSKPCSGESMRLSVILAHPNKQSFNHAIAETAVAELERLGHDLVFHDLYDEGFDPILPHDEIPKETTLPWELESHCKEISLADGIIIIHPNWWGQPPRVLGGRQGRRGACRPVESQGRARIQHIKHSSRAGTDGVRRSPRNALEELYVQPLWYRDLLSQNVQCRCYQYRRPTPQMVGRCSSDCEAILSDRVRRGTSTRSGALIRRSVSWRAKAAQLRTAT